jgi:UDP-N-acetylglucosamine transferase subunit ALG13
VIFVTVGTQLPFDRLVGAVDGWAGAGEGREVFAQVGPSVLRPEHLAYERFIPPAECRERMLAAKAIVAHAGMGTILTALELGKPIVVMPRRAALREHRNDHQLATANRFVQLGLVSVAFDETELPAKLDELDRLAARRPISPYASDGFISALRAFIDGPSETVAA